MNTGSFNRRCEDLAELAMMGKFVPIREAREVDFITNYILDVFEKRGWINGEEIAKRIERVNAEVTHIGTCRVLGMPCIVYVLYFRDDDMPKPFEEEYCGYKFATCYVFNMSADEECSEFGDCFFEKREDGYYHRVS